MRHSGWWPDRVTRLFRRGHARFSDDLVHERLVVEGATGTLHAPLMHEAIRDLDEALRASGAVDGSECTALGAILSQAAIRTVALTNSGGGNARAGYCVGDLIRERGLSTVIRGRCASSCSRMWVQAPSRP